MSVRISINGIIASAWVCAPLNEPPYVCVYIGREEGGAIVDTRSYRTLTAPRHIEEEWLMGFVAGVMEEATRHQASSAAAREGE